MTHDDKCPILDEWFKHKPRYDLALEQIQDMHATVKTLAPIVNNSVGDIKGLLQTQNSLLSDMNKNLVAPATGKDQMPMQTAMYGFKVFGWVIFALVAIIVFLLTGQHLGWIGPLHN